MKIFAQSPSRISLFGGGTDLPSYHNGIVINLAINLRSEVLLDTEDYECHANKLPPNANIDLYYSILQSFELNFPFLTFKTTSDAHVGKGLGTSGSAGVALIKAIDKFKGLEMTREEIAEKAFEIERTLWNTGRQDVYASAYGGMNVFLFGDKVEVHPINRDIAENIKKHLFLYYIEGERKPQAKSLSNLDAIKEIALKANTNLENPEMLGYFLDQSWQEKKKSNSNVSNPKIDKIYNKVMEKRAWGFKLCGSGGAGYCIVMAEKKPKLNLQEVDYDLDFTGVEARIL